MRWFCFTHRLHFYNKYNNRKHFFCPIASFSPRQGRKCCVPFVSLHGVSTWQPAPTHPLPNLQSHQTAFFQVLSPPELQSFHWPAHTRTQLYCAPATPVIQRLLLMARQRLLSPENAAAMRTISPEHAEEFGHTWEVFGGHSFWHCETGTGVKMSVMRKNESVISMFDISLRYNWSSIKTLFPYQFQSI